MGTLEEIGSPPPHSLSHGRNMLTSQRANEVESMGHEVYRCGKMK
jgi:hypothetical protein